MSEGTMLMKRMPIYHDKNPHVRMVSAPDGMWQVQEKQGRDDHKTKTESGWRNINRPMSEKNARSLMASRAVGR